jgi:hypothetical protein
VSSDVGRALPARLIPGCSQKSIFSSGEWFSKAVKSAILGLQGFLGQDGPDGQQQPAKQEEPAWRFSPVSFVTTTSSQFFKTFNMDQL